MILPLFTASLAVMMRSHLAGIRFRSFLMRYVPLILLWIWKPINELVANGSLRRNDLYEKSCSDGCRRGFPPGHR